MNDGAPRKPDLFDDPTPPPRRRVAPVVPVSRFVADTRMLLERDIGLTWISGEISGCSRAASGHLYFTLKDATAQIRCVFFRHKAQGLAFSLREGLAVEVCAVPTIYDARGELQLNVETMRLAGLGALYERFVQMKAKLEAAGLFNAARKRSMPSFPRCIGIVTSRQAAALRDVLTTLSRRMPSVPVIIYPASVQGAGAPRDIAAAIRAANGHARVDVLIVCRGGGSLEDLWAFNEEIVARAVFDSRIPIVSGVGHETDFTICDFVADVRAPTPTAAAALVVGERGTLARQLRDRWRRLARACAHHASSRAQRLDAASRRLVHPAARLAAQAQQMRVLATRLARAFQQQQALESRRLAAARARLVRELRAPLPQTMRLAQLKATLTRAGRQRVAIASRALTRCGESLELLNPSAVLDRGYAIVTGRDGSIVVDSRLVARGDTVELTFARGRAGATITTTDEG